MRLFARTVRFASHLHVCDGDLSVRKSDPWRIDPLGQLSAGCAWDVGRFQDEPLGASARKPTQAIPGLCGLDNVLSA